MMRGRERVWCSMFGLVMGLSGCGDATSEDPSAPTGTENSATPEPEPAVRITLKGQESTYAYSLLVLTYDKGDDRIRDYYLVGSNTEVACDDVDPKDSVFDVTTMLREAEEEHVVIDWANDFGGVDLAVWTVEGGSGDKVEVEVFSGDEVSCVFDPERYPDDGTLAVDCDSTRYENARDDAQVIASGSVCVLRG